MSRSPEAMTKIMKGVHSKNTRPEMKLRKTLWRMGIRYRINYTNLIGKPDIVITRCRIAIFVDGDFWHGHDMKKINSQIKQNRNYWLPKLKKNRMRDAEVNDTLNEEGWIILRFWESDIKNHFDQCIDTIISYIPYIQKKHNTGD